MSINFAVLSTYPPTQCGLATFSQALIASMAGTDAHVTVARVVDVPEGLSAPVTHEYVLSEHGSAQATARALNAADAVIVQHEYGIFAGRDGAEVLDVLAGVRVPVISVLHTVLTSPSPNQHRILAGVIARSSALVTMTQTARDRLIAGWDVDPNKVLVIPHGAAENRAQADDPVGDGRPTVLTWGLIGPGKGIEWAIEAMAELTDLDPAPRYLIVGETHPRVLERDGQAYRDRLVNRVAELGLESIVQFHGEYLATADLLRMVRAADIILLPYDSREQVTSGVLTEAVVAGKAVVSTSFPHAVELLSSGAGLLVPQGDSGAIAEALRWMLCEPGLLAATSATSAQLAEELHWPAVGRQYIDLGRSLRRQDAQKPAGRSVA